MHYKETEYGFEWGAENVIRHCSDEKEGWVILGIETPKHKKGVEIYVTRTGKVRIYSDDGEWIAPKAGGRNER
jgi:hypothetical protein